MEVVTINSPNKDKWNTALILDPFMEGMKKRAEVKLYYTRDLNNPVCLMLIFE